MAGPLGSPPRSTSYDHATLEKLVPWIVTSPPRPAQSSYQAPFLQHQSDQPFVAFSYKRPSKKAQEPTVLQLTIAPIDVIYSQLCLLSLLDFLNAAWPAEGLDPLKVRAGVSLKEIVQEKLSGGKRQHQMARRQHQHSMQRTKVPRCFTLLSSLPACLSNAAHLGSQCNGESGLFKGYSHMHDLVVQSGHACAGSVQSMPVTASAECLRSTWVMCA